MKPLTTVFGAVIGFGKMGNCAVRACIVPQIAYLAERIEPHLATSADNTSSKLDKQASKYIRHRLVKVCTPVLKNLRSTPDVAGEYVAAYGSLGESLCHAVIVSRIKDTTAKVTKSEGGAKVAKSKSSHSHKNSKGSALKHNGIRRTKNSIPPAPRPRPVPPIKAMNGTLPQRLLCFPNGHKQLVTYKQIPHFRNGLVPKAIHPIPVPHELDLKQNTITILQPIKDQYAVMPLGCHNGRNPLNYPVKERFLRE